MNKNKVKSRLLNPWLFKFWMWRRLPSVGFWGVHVDDISDEKCTIRLPFSWFTQNPFQSIYFSALCGAAELSTGLLCQYHMADLGSCSMLVTGFKSEFYKKATTPILFICTQGNELAEVLASLTKPGDTATLSMISQGKNSHGELVAQMEILWSFKKR